MQSPALIEFWTNQVVCAVLLANSIDRLIVVLDPIYYFARHRFIVKGLICSAVIFPTLIYAIAVTAEYALPNHYISQICPYVNLPLLVMNFLKPVKDIQPIIQKLFQDWTSFSYTCISLCWHGKNLFRNLQHLANDSCNRHNETVSKIITFFKNRSTFYISWIKLVIINHHF